MGRIIYTNDPMNPAPGAKFYTWNGPFIEFLEKYYPDGFDGPYVVARDDGTKVVPLDDFDFTPGPDETVAIVEHPLGGGIEALLIQTAISFAVGFAVNLLINLLFPPPDAQKDRSPSPVYTFNARQNSARLGDPVPVIYGNVVTYPNLAAQPYYDYIGNEQYFYALLVIGAGEYDVDEVLIGNDSEAALPPDIVEWRKFGPSEHGGQWGVVQSNFPVFEDMVTSQQVSNAVLSGGEWRGWYEANLPGTRVDAIWVDYAFPNGLIWIDREGRNKNWTIYFNLEIQPINDAGEVIGGALSYRFYNTLSTRNPQRLTYGVGVGLGRYRVRFRRETPETVSNRNTYIENTNFLGLRARINRYGQQAYGNTSLLAVRIKASEGVSTTAQTQIRARVRRRLQRLNDQSFGATSNPADIFFDILTNPSYGADRPVSEVDLQTVMSLRNLYASHSGFNGQFDTRTTVWEALRQAVLPVRGRPIPVDGLTSIIQDGPQATRAALFSPENIVAGSFKLQYSFRQDESYDGYEVTFLDAVDFLEDSRLYPATSARPKRVSMLGNTDPNNAERYARLLWQQDIYQRKFCEFSTELEGLIYPIGARFGVSFPLANWGQSARIESVSGTTATLDRGLTFPPNPYAFYRDEKGGVSPPLRIQAAAGVNIKQFSAIDLPSFPVFGRGRQEATYVAIGGGADFVQDFVISKIEPAADGTVKIYGVVYDERVWSSTLGLRSWQA